MTDEKKNETPASTKPSAPAKGPDAPSTDKSNVAVNTLPQTPSTKTVAPQPVDDEAKKAPIDLSGDAELKDDPEFDAAMAEKDNEVDPSLSAQLDGIDRKEYPEDLKETMDKLRRLHKVIPTTTPNEHTLWGAGGVVLTIKDIRTLIKYGGLDSDED